MKKQILIVQGGGRPKGNAARAVSAFAQGTESYFWENLLQTPKNRPF